MNKSQGRGVSTRGWSRLALGVAALGAVSSLTTQASAYEIYDKLNAQVTAQPIEVVYWVQDGVSAAAEAQTTADIDAALAAWDAIPTACVSFHKNRVVHSATQPTKASSELMAVIAVAGSGWGGGGLPGYQGYPTNFVVLGSTAPQLGTALHESGHSLGLYHSTLSDFYPEQQRAIMNWATGPTALSPDDIAALSLNYPCTQAPLSAVTGSVTGRLVTQYGVPASGVNVIAYDVVNNKAVVARPTGQLEEADGAFRLDGIPPGTYRLEYRGAESFGGGHIEVDTRADPYNNPYLGGFQAENFTPFTSANFTIGAGQTQSFGDVPITIDDTKIVGYGGNDYYPWMIRKNWLETAMVGVAYNQYLRVKGGLRDITATVTGLPAGLTGRLAGSSNGYANGITNVQISGTPTQSGYYPVTITLTDHQGRVKVLPYNISVGPIAPTGVAVVGRYDFLGDTGDRSGNNHNATLVGSGYQWALDRYGNGSGAITLNRGQYLQLPDESAFDLTEYSLVMNVKLPTLSWWDDYLVSKGVGMFGNYSFQRSTGLGGVAMYAHGATTGDWMGIFSNDPLPANQDICVAVTVGGGSADSYLNGVLQVHYGSVPTPTLNNEPVRFGIGGYDSPDTYMKGTLDDVTIFRGKLTQAQVQSACQ